MAGVEPLAHSTAVVSAAVANTTSRSLSGMRFIAISLMAHLPPLCPLAYQCMNLLRSKPIRWMTLLWKLPYKLDV